VDVAVHNVEPTLAISGAADVNEGALYTLNLSSLDPGADTISQWTINWGDGIQVVSGNPASATHTYADGDANYTISATATDEDGTFAAGNTVDVAVHNVAPTLSIAGAADVNEGALYTLNLSSSDPGADTITQWTINWGDGVQVVAGNPSSVTHTYADGDANYVISATATDEDGTFAAGNTVALAVHNVAPTLTISGDADVNEGALYTLNLSSSDPGADTITQWTINWGDGIQVVVGNPSSVTHTYADGDANYTVSATATDEDGTFAAGNTVDVTVHNVAPTLTISGAPDVNEGELYTLNLSSSDPGMDTISQWTINWGDSVEVVSGNPASVTHTYADGDANYVISATATDEDGTFAAGNTVAVSVHNVEPTLAINGAPDVNEGALYTLNLSSSDPGTDTITQWTINWGDSVQVVSGNPASVTHTYADGDANYVISATATDEDGTFAAGNTVAVTVHNVAPTLAISGAATVNEGSPYTLNLSSSDPGTDTIAQWTINWGDSVEVVSGNPASATHTYADGGNSYVISATATDEDGTFAAGNTVAVSVLNVDPTLTISGPSDIDEGSLYTLSLSSSDPGIDSISQWTITWGDGNVQVVAGNPASVTHTYLDGDNNYVISATATDEDGTFAAGNTVAVTVHNVAPTVALNTVPDISENGFATLTGSFTDIGITDAHTVTIDWGDLNNSVDSVFAVDAIQDTSGTATLHVNDTFSSSDGALLEITSIDSVTGTVGFTVQHQYLDDGLAPGDNTSGNISTISVDVHDDHVSGLDSTSVTVNNVTPTVALDAGSSTNENGLATLSGSYTDIGLLDAHTVTVNWGDPNNSTESTFTVAAIQNAAGATTLHAGDSFSSLDGATLIIIAVDESTGKVEFGVQHQYLDDGHAPGNGTASDVDTITVTVADDDAQSGNNTTPVTVNNVAPHVDSVGANPIVENGVATLGVTYTDFGRLDAQTITIDWADPNNITDSVFSVSAVMNAAGTATLHVNDTFSSADGAVLTITAVNTATGQVSFTVQHQYLDDGVAPGNGTTSDTANVGVTITDDDGQTGTGAGSVEINNLMPQIGLEAVPDINENGIATLTGTFSDTGLVDEHTLTISWGDENNPDISTFQIDAIFNSGGNQTLTVGETFGSITDGASLLITAVDTATGQVSFSVEHQYLDDGTAPGNNTISDVSIIGATIADDDGLDSSTTTSVTVFNVAPTVGLNTVADINEHDFATLTGSFTDIGLSDVHSLTVHWGDDNNSVDSTFTVDPTATLTSGQTFGSSSGDGAMLTITDIDAATGEVSFSVQHQYLDDGHALGNNTTSDTSTITVTVADDDAQSGNNTTTVTVHNVTPAVALNAVADINENGIATLTGSYTDIGLLDAHTVTVNWGDLNNSAESIFSVSAVQNAGGGATLHANDMFSSADGAVLKITSVDALTGEVKFSVEHQYLDDGLALGNGTTSDTSTISVTVADDDAQSGNHTTTVTVHNVTPAVALNPVIDIDENGIATLSGSYTDTGRLDAHTLTVSWGDANNGAESIFAVNAIRTAGGATTLHANDTFASSDGAVLTIISVDPATGKVEFSVQHQYLDDGAAPGNGTIADTSTISVTVLDDDTQSGNNTTPVTVHNVAPTIVDLTGDSITEGHTATVTFDVSDPGTLEVFTANVDWRDGSTATITGLGAIDASGTVGTTVYSWTAATRQLSVTHLYADNSDYAVVVRLADDDMAADFAGAADPSNFVTQTTLVTVANVPPILGGTTGLSVNEGSAFTLAGLGVHLEDIGFDNPLNETPPSLGDPFQETFAAATIDWGDGRGPIPVTIDNVAGRVSGSAGVNTLAQFIHSAYTYADDGTYTVTIRVADDNMAAFADAAKFVTGTAGVDFVDLTFQIQVNNVAPTLAAPVTSPVVITEANSVNFTVGFSDPGFDNPLNPNTNPASVLDPKSESFRYFLDWGDGRNQVGTSNVADTNGSVGVPSTGSFGSTHNYADDGTYTVTIRLADDNMGAFTNAALFQNGVAGVDYVEKTFVVTVNNTVPTITQALNGDQVSPQGFTQIRLAWNDPGYDNALNPTTPPVGDPHAESFTYIVNWGDGTTDTILVSNVSGTAQVINSQTSVLTSTRVNGAEGVLTTGSFEVQHLYNGPPDPLNPTADITITVTLLDDNQGSVQQTIAITNPGIQTANVAIDTTPDVPKLVFVPPQVPQRVLDQSSAAPLSLVSAEQHTAHNEMITAQERYLELVVLSPDGEIIETHRLSDEALSDMRGFFATLPDNRYQIVLVRGGSRRTVFDVFVRRGRVIDPSDTSEGTRDKPPTSEGEQQNNGQQNGAQQNGGQQNGAPQNNVVPLNANPLLQPANQNPPNAAIEAAPPVVELAPHELDPPTVRNHSSARWAGSLAAVGIAATSESWSRRLEAAWDAADETSWQRLRNAGRLGRRPSSKIKT
jgi:hypothetical protein